MPNVSWLRSLSNVWSQRSGSQKKSKSRSSRSRREGRSSAIEVLEARRLLAGDPVLLGSVTIPQGANTWNPSDPAFLAAPLFADVNADGKQDVIAVNNNNQLVAYTYSTTGDPVQVLRVYSQTGTAADIRSTPAIANVPGVGLAIFAGTVDGRVFAWNASTGALLPGWPATVDLPDGSQPNANLSNTIYGGVAVADLDGDSNPEVLVTSVNHELTVFRSNGSVYWRFNNDAQIVGTPVIGDLNRDGLVDVVIAGNSTSSDAYTQGGRITALSGDGRRMWVFSSDQDFQSSPTLGDMDGNGYLEVYIGTGATYPDAGNRVFGLSHRGQLLSGWPVATSDGSLDARVTNSPVLVNLGDGQGLVLLVSDSSTAFRLIRVNSDLDINSVLAVTSASKVYGSPVVADINGDNSLDFIFAAGLGVIAVDTDSGGTWTLNEGGNVYFRSVAIGHFKGDASWQLAVLSDSTESGVNSVSTLQIFDLEPSTTTPQWNMTRRDATGGNALVRSDEQLTTLITNLYETLLARTPGQAEIDGWLNSLRNAPKIDPLLDAILGSAEYRNVLITNLYVELLGRNPDAAGLEYFQQFLLQGNSTQAAIALIAASDEAFINAGSSNQQWVANLYANLLERSATQAEIDSWVAQLNAGTTTRVGIVTGFVYSVEYTQKQVTEFYNSVMGFQPSDADLFATAWEIRRGKRLETVYREIVVAGEGYIATHLEGSAIRQMYRDVLDRGASDVELIDWMAKIEQGATLQLVASSLVQSQEYRVNLVLSYYVNFLGRAPTDAEVNSWVTQLNNGATREQVILGFVQSNEFQARAGNTLAGVVNLTYVKLLGREATAGDQAYWQAQPDPYGMLPVVLLRTEEYFRREINQWYFDYVRRLPNTQADGSAFFNANTPYGAQAQVNQLVSGGNQESVQIALLASAEYSRLTKTGALWNGTKWLYMDNSSAL